MKTVARRYVFLAASLGAVFLACNNNKVNYTIPKVKGEIAEARREALHHRRKGELIKASKVILKAGKKILNEYPKATMSQETVKRFLRTAVRIGNLCLDKGQELQQEAISDRMWKLSAAYKKRHQRHRKLNKKLRELIPTLPESEVSAKARPTALPAPGTAPRPAATTTDATPAAQGETTPPARPGEGAGEAEPARPQPATGSDLPPPEKPRD